MATTNHKRLKPGGKVTLKLPVEQVDLIVEKTLIDDDLLATIHAAKVHDDIASIKCTLDDLDELAGYVAAVANNTKEKKLRRELDAISDQIDRLNLSYAETVLPIVGATAGQQRLRLVKK